MLRNEVYYSQKGLLTCRYLHLRLIKLLVLTVYLNDNCIILVVADDLLRPLIYFMIARCGFYCVLQPNNNLLLRLKFQQYRSTGEPPITHDVRGKTNRSKNAFIHFRLIYHTPEIFNIRAKYWNPLVAIMSIINITLTI